MGKSISLTGSERELNPRLYIVSSPQLRNMWLATFAWSGYSGHLMSFTGQGVLLIPFMLEVIFLVNRQDSCLPSFLYSFNLSLWHTCVGLTFICQWV